MQQAISLETVRNLIAIIDKGLVEGVGQPEAGQCCVEAAICLALGEPHGDEPTCVHPTDRSLSIALNDKSWSSDEARAQGLRRLAVMQLGTAGTDRDAWLDKLIELHIRRVVPLALRAAAWVNHRFTDELVLAADRCAAQGTPRAARAAREIANKAAADAADAAAAAAYAADVAAYAAYAAAAAAYAADADAAAYAADAAAAAAAERSRLRDFVLSEAARCVEMAYEQTGSTGLDLLLEMEREAA